MDCGNVLLNIGSLRTATNNCVYTQHIQFDITFFAGTLAVCHFAAAVRDTGKVSEITRRFKNDMNCPVHPLLLQFDRRRKNQVWHRTIFSYLLFIVTIVNMILQSETCSSDVGFISDVIHET